MLCIIYAIAHDKRGYDAITSVVDQALRASRPGGVWKGRLVSLPQILAGHVRLHGMLDA